MRDQSLRPLSHVVKSLFVRSEPRTFAMCLVIAPLLAAACTAPRRAGIATERTLTASEARTALAAPIVTEDGVVVSPARYLSHISLLAHDELGGRGTGSHGIDLAAGYIAGQFAAAGLQPGGLEGTYFQPFTVHKGAKLLDDETRLTIKEGTIPADLRDDFIPLSFSAKGDFEGTVVFVGYGIANPDRSYDDYKDIDVKGKIALMLRREPPGWKEAGFTEHATFATKTALAAEHGAVAVVIVNQDPGEEGEDTLMPFRGRGAPATLPAIHMKRSLADRLLAAGGGSSLADLQVRLDEEKTNASFMLEDVTMAGRVAYESEKVWARNVIGVLPGSGPRASEYVVIGGHYDHLGTRRKRIYNGADDNASGTAGVMELAWAFSRTHPRSRSVLFVAFSGEEMGLLGSRHYVADPTVPIESIQTMINMDMIGRLRPDDQANMLGIQGLGTGDSFEGLVSRLAAKANMKYIPDPSAQGPSDHDSFYRAGVPSLFFFTGIHPDYHRPGDDTEKINAEGGARIVSLIYDIALALINETSAPKYVVVDQPAKIMRGVDRRPGVVMGIMPDMEDESEQKGWRIARVFPDGGAARAGMKSGDRITTIDGRAIHDFFDYREATAGKKPGDTVSVTVLRGSQERMLEVKLAARPTP